LQIKVAADKNIGFDTSDGEARISSYNDAITSAGPLHFNGSYLRFEIASNERARIDSSGRLLVGTSSARSQLGITPGVQSEGTDFSQGTLALTVNSTSQYPLISLARSRGATLGSNTIVADGDIVGKIFFTAADGNDMASAAATIEAVIDGTPGSDDLPGRLVFSTSSDNSASPTERMRITSDAYVRLASGTGGIQFNGDTAAANALDDYEEGSWSPVYTPSSGSFTTMTMSVSGARYVKIGQQITVSAYFYSSSVDVTGASGSVNITGLPFTSRTTQDVRYSGGIGYAVGFTIKPIDWYIENGTTTVVLLASKTNNDSLDVADLATGSGFLNAMFFTATYFVN
jgi:hypothetical protein